MTPEPLAARDWDDDLVFRTLAAPGLEEDDLIAAKAAGGLWGSGRPAAGMTGVVEADIESRTARHNRLLAKWPPLGDSAEDARGRPAATRPVSGGSPGEISRE